MTTQGLTQDNSIKRQYETGAAGLLAGGTVTHCTRNHKLSKLSKETLKAFQNTDAKECDAFVKKNNSIIAKAIESKKGFFGKINAKIAQTNKSEMEDIAGYTDEILKDYAKKATNAVSKKRCANQEDAYKKLYDKLISKDILKSFKNATKYENIVKTTAGAVVGLFAACVIKEIATKYSEKRAEGKEINTEVETEGQKRPVARASVKKKKEAEKA